MSIIKLNVLNLKVKKMIVLAIGMCKTHRTFIVVIDLLKYMHV